MTISNSTSKAVQVTDASLNAYSFPFKVFKAAELAVSCVDSVTKMETRLTLQNDFTVNGLNADSGGLVVLTASGQDIAGTGNNLVIRRDLDFVQNMDIRPHDVMPAETLERAFDILTMETQQLREEIQRALVAPPDQDKAITWNEIAGQFNQASAALDAARAAAAAAEASAKSAEISAGKLENSGGQGGDIAAHNADPAAHAALFESRAALFTTKIRRRLSANATLFVRPDGNDGNGGSENTAEKAFLTIARALEELRRIDGSGYEMTLSIAPGTYNEVLELFEYHTNTFKNFSVNGGGTIDPPSGNYSVILREYAKCALFGMKLLGGVNACHHSSPHFSGAMTIDYQKSSLLNVVNVAAADLEIQGAFNLSGNAYAALLAAEGGKIHLTGQTHVLNSPAYSYFAVAQSGGYIYRGAGTIDGAATGARYLCNLDGIINSRGAGPNFFPGDAAGSVGSGGGIYV